jgi:hypothetical protein
MLFLRVIMVIRLWAIDVETRNKNVPDSIKHKSSSSN